MKNLKEVVTKKRSNRSIRMIPKPKKVKIKQKNKTIVTQPTI